MQYYGNYTTLQITKKQALSCSHQGECYDDIKALREIPAIKRQLDKIPEKDLLTELYDTGGWCVLTIDADTRIENEYRLLWIACCSISEEIKKSR